MPDSTDSSLKSRLERDMVASMKAHDDVRKQTLRLVLTAISKAETSGKSQHTLSDDEVASVISAEAKVRRDAVEFYRDNGHPDRADAEEAEAAVLAEYLPEQLSAEQIAELTRTTIAELGAQGPKDMGKVMGALRAATKDKADGAVVAAEVKRQLLGS